MRARKERGGRRAPEGRRQQAGARAMSTCARRRAAGGISARIGHGGGDAWKGGPCGVGGHEEMAKDALELDGDMSGTPRAWPEHAMCVQERGHQMHCGFG